VTRVLRVDPTHPDPVAIAEAAGVLERGGLVAFPTETVYGLGARGLHAEEVAKIFAAKGRPAGHPVILHVDGDARARALAAEWSDTAALLARDFWPGPLTLVVPRAPNVPPEVSGGLDTVGIRAPNHAVALALIRAVGEPLAAPSANAHTHISPTTADHVLRSLGDKVDLILDAGACAHGIESTVVEVGTGGSALRVLRPGAITLDQLRAVDPNAVDAAGIIEGDAPRAAPGRAAKH
jgi:L-threonylcarbamoyladenylate synthase